MKNKNIGKILKELRLSYQSNHPPTVSEMAKRIGIPESTLHSLETGRSSPTLKTIEKVLHFYGKTLKDLEKDLES